MTDLTKPLPAADDAWLEGLLREDGVDHDAAYLPDEGFTAKVMAALPAPVALPAWRRPVLAALWGLAGAGVVAALPAGAPWDAINQTLRLVFSSHLNLTELAAVAVGLSAATWIGGWYALKQG